jgi:hypothetical protein
MDKSLMCKPRSITPLAALALFSALALPSPAAAQGTPLFTADKEACFGRVYDQAHLRAHPQQKVTSIHILRSLSERPQAENWEPNQREEAIKRFQESGETAVSAFVTFRDRRGYFHNSLTCGRDDKGGMHCFIECDGGSFAIKRESATTALLTNNGFVLVGGCGEEVESGKEVFFDPGKDDKVFRLETKPVAVCRAEEQKAIPISADKPLRERFKEDETFCFGRDYDAAHLTSHPQQQVAAMRVARLDPAKEKDEFPDAPQWWHRVKLSVTMTLKTGRKLSTARYGCFAQQASWECRREPTGEGHTACSDRTIQLGRGPGDDVFVYNRNSGLPIDNECETAGDSGQFPSNPPTKSDDKTFRLTRMPVAACQ